MIKMTGCTKKPMLKFTLMPGYTNPCHTGYLMSICTAVLHKEDDRHVAYMPGIWF
jgi:hypothetical protein